MRDFPFHAHIPSPDRQVAEVNRESTPLWDSSQIATPNQHRSGLTVKEQISLQLTTRLQPLQGKTVASQVATQAPEGLARCKSVKTLFLIQSQDGEVLIINATLINVHEKFPGTIRSSGARPCTENPAIQSRCPCVVQSDDSTFFIKRPIILGNSNHPDLKQKLGEIRSTQAIKELTKQGLKLQVQVNAESPQASKPGAPAGA